MATLKLENIGKSYGDIVVIDDMNLEVNTGEFIVFIGPSGCGKSTALRMIAGLEEISFGNLMIDGKRVNDTHASKREVAMVFQSYALYPHMSVYKNMAFSLMLAKVSQEKIDEQVKKAAEILQITQYLDRLPKDLSGGQRQRVAIGRAIVRNPKIFLFDEPLSNLDAALRGQTRLEIARLHQKLGSTMVYVTHDQLEAMTLADRIVVLNKGKIEQVGSPLTLYNEPKNLFVAGFIGSPKMNLLETNRFHHTNFIHQEWAQKTVTIGIRPENIHPVDSIDEACLSGTVEVQEHLGEHILAYLRDDHNEMFIVKFNFKDKITIGEKINFRVDEHYLHLFDSSGNRLN